MSEIPADVRELATRLFDMARQGDLALVDYIEQGISPDLSNEDGNSLLMFAAYHGHPALVTELLARGGDVEKSNNRGQTPLAGAVFKKFDEVVDVLLAHGANPDGGSPSALATARMFEMSEQVAKLEAAASGSSQ